MPGVRSAARTQLGLEATKGTAVPATAIWMGPVAFLEDATEVILNKQDIAIIGGIDRSHIPKYAGKCKFPSTEATFEQLPYILSAGIKDVVSGAADGAGTSKIYDYPLSLTSANAVKAYTIEGYDDQQEEEAAFGTVEAFELKLEAEKAWMISSDWFCFRPGPSTKTSLATLPTVEDILTQKTKLYIDAVGGTIGTTQKTKTLLAANIKVRTGFVPYWTADGDLNFSDVKMGNEIGWEIEAAITFEHDGTAVAEKAAFQAQTSRLLRLQAHGSAVGTPGTVYTYKTARLDLPGKWTKFSIIESKDGNDTVTGTFVSRYNVTAALGPSILVVNELSSLP